MLNIGQRDPRSIRPCTHRTPRTIRGREPLPSLQLAASPAGSNKASAGGQRLQPDVGGGIHRNRNQPHHRRGTLGGLQGQIQPGQIPIMREQNAVPSKKTQVLRSEIGGVQVGKDRAHPRCHPLRPQPIPQRLSPGQLQQRTRRGVQGHVQAGGQSRRVGGPGHQRGPQL